MFYLILLLEMVLIIGKGNILWVSIIIISIIIISIPSRTKTKILQSKIFSEIGHFRNSIKDIVLFESYLKTRCEYQLKAM